MNALTRLNNPLWPLLLVILSPLVTLPVSWGILILLPNCGLDEPWWDLTHMRLALLPGFVDLVPIVWLASAKTQVRKAASIAGVVGVIRVALPQMAVGIYAARFGGQDGDPACAVFSFLLIPLVLLMLAVWAVSVLICAFALRRLTRAVAG